MRCAGEQSLKSEREVQTEEMDPGTLCVEKALRAKE